MKNKTIRKIIEVKSNIDSMSWIDIWEQLTEIDELNDLVEKQFEKENEELRIFKSNTEDFYLQIEESKKLDIKKMEWLKKFVKNFEK